MDSDAIITTRQEEPHNQLSGVLYCMATKLPVDPESNSMLTSRLLTFPASSITFPQVQTKELILRIASLPSMIDCLTGLSGGSQLDNVAIP